VNVHPGEAVISAVDDHGEPIISVHKSGRVFWHGQEVFTDEDFRGAMKELIRQLLPTTTKLDEYFPPMPGSLPTRR
jgi:hypothetical protein